ncbi:MAG: DsbA family oxidoreductase [Solirubrobacteraceae bacterium]|nr:DsbA family oxidoreductase [Solirubrobacteraceae bacterium]
MEVWSDLGCPWCYIGAQRLRRAIGALPAAVAERVDVTHRAFELDPSAGRTPIPIREIFTRKHGATPAQADAAEAQIARLAATEGLAFDRERRHANSLDVHRVAVLAGGRGADLFDEIQRGFFSGTLDPYDHEVLIEAAARVGVDPERVREVLGSDELTAQVRADERRAAQLGITGVPFVLIDGTPLAGANTVDAYSAALTAAAHTRPTTDLVGQTCTPGGDC